MKRIITWSLLIITSLTLTACGITEELEQAKNAVDQLKTALVTQGSLYEQLSDNVNEIPAALAADLEAAPAVGLYPESRGAVYDVIADREALLTEMSAVNKEVIALKKEIQRIIKKEGADVDNAQLLVINQSLDIVLSDFDSLEVYLSTSDLLEKDFFGQLPTEKMKGQLSIIYRTYGSIEIISEEAFANLEYTLALIHTFEKEAPKNKENKQ